MIVENKMQNKNNNIKMITKDNEEDNESNFSLILEDGNYQMYTFNKGFGQNKTLNSVWCYYKDATGDITSKLNIEITDINNMDNNDKKPVKIYPYMLGRTIILDNIYYNAIKCCLVDENNNVINLNTAPNIDITVWEIKDDDIKYIKDNGTNFSNNEYELYILILCS